MVGCQTSILQRLYTSNMEPIRKINKIKRRITRVPLIPKIEILGAIILEALQRHVHTLKDSRIAFPPNASKYRMWE